MWSNLILLFKFYFYTTTQREDKDGKGCDFYEYDKTYCISAPKWADRKGISALDACCFCNGGNQGTQNDRCEDNDDFMDSDGFSCDKYDQYPHWCDAAEKYEKNGKP